MFSLSWNCECEVECLHHFPLNNFIHIVRSFVRLSLSLFYFFFYYYYISLLFIRSFIDSMVDLLFFSLLISIGYAAAKRKYTTSTEKYSFDKTIFFFWFFVGYVMISNRQYKIWMAFRRQKLWLKQISQCSQYSINHIACFCWKLHNNFFFVFYFVASRAFFFFLAPGSFSSQVNKYLTVKRNGMNKVDLAQISFVFFQIIFSNEKKKTNERERNLTNELQFELMRFNKRGFSINRQNLFHFFRSFVRSSFVIEQINKRL